MNLYGCRKVRVFNGVTEGEVDRHGSYGYIEVENPGAKDAEFMVNEFLHQGHPGTTIKIKAGTTRAIPLTIYNFKSTEAVNIVAYGL